MGAASILAGLTMAGLLAACGPRGGDAPAGVGAPIQHAAGNLSWQPGPATMPPGTFIMVLEGDPRVAGLFTIRLKLPAGARLGPHWHPRDERVTVLHGRVGVGFGERFDGQALRDFDGGSYYVNPARQPHFIEFRQESVVQITGIGPWETHFLESPAP
jgi:hypothetical protein